MKTRRDFFRETGAFSIGSMLLSSCNSSGAGAKKVSNTGVQLYTFRKEMLADAIGTLKLISALGIKQIESAVSDKGNYYGLKPKDIRQACSDLGMTLRSGHVHIDDKWQQTLSDAVDAGQEYLICSTMPARGQTVDNYKLVSETFNKAGEDCKKVNIKFGYHNHDYEFEQENGQTLYDILLMNTDPALVHMELDLGWVMVGGKDPLDYFSRYKGRFPLWHLKDMDLAKKHSVEFGKGSLPIVKILQHSEEAGMKYFFVEQEEYAVTALESMADNMQYLQKLDY
jgi:sugar phosphate isomerase/epimerase